jgi:NAD(P)-dependent dehydrogenase (short-subunit alcohol dehydrogenase family)
MTGPDVAARSWRLDGEVALVTGASSGLGARFAQVLCDAGAQVVATARRGDRLDELSSRCGPAVGTIAGDIADASFRQALLDHVADTHGRLDLLVNNAGTADDGPIQEQSLAELQRVVDVNLVSVLDLCRLAAGPLLAAPSGRVVNVASMFGVVASPGPMAGYNATKGALVNLTRHLAAQWGAQGVRVNALAPGYFPTEMTGHFEDGHLARAVERRTLLGRTARIEEIDGPFLFLASSASSYVTGQVLVVDGGWTAV